MQDRYRMRATDFYPGFSFARVLRDLRFAIQDGCRIHATKNRKCSEPILHFVLCITDLSAPPRLQPHSLGRWALLTVRIFFFREDFRGDAAISSFVNLSFGRSRFLGRYEGACSHIPMLRFGMRAPNERPLALRSVGIAKLRVWVGTIRMSMGICVSNCGSAALGHIFMAAPSHTAEGGCITKLTVRIFFFREDFRGDAAISSFVYLRFGRSRFLCRYERACSHIPMLRFGMRAPNERALALRSVGIAKLRYGWAPYR